jgi:hypothetical protein
MSVLGFREAYLNSVFIQVRPSPLAEVAVVSPVGLTLLKLIDWSESSPNLRPKHAADLVFIAANYLDLGNAERVYDHDDLMEDFDYQITGVRLLGRDLAAIISGRTVEAVLRILEIETSERGNLPAAMSRGVAPLSPELWLELLALSNSVSLREAETIDQTQDRWTTLTPITFSGGFILRFHRCSKKRASFTVTGEPGAKPSVSSPGISQGTTSSASGDLSTSIR